MRARELMSTPVITVRPDSRLKAVAEQMAAHAVSGVPVVDESNHLVGIISESDVLAKLEYADKEGRSGGGLLKLLDRLAQLTGVDLKWQARTAAELMTTPVLTAGPDASVREVVHLMVAHAVNRVPIVESGRVIGIITRADILRTLTRPDAAIIEDIRWRLAHDLWIDTDKLDITSHNGIVTIAGDLETRSDAELATRWAATTEGVVGVEAAGLRYQIDDHRIKIQTERLR